MSFLQRLSSALRSVLGLRRSAALQAQDAADNAMSTLPIEQPSAAPETSHESAGRELIEAARARARQTQSKPPE